MFLSIFYIYLLYVLKYTIFPISISGSMVEIFREELAFSTGINIIPFNFDSINYLLSKQVFYNILLSIPFGFGISYIISINRKKLIFFGIMFGIIIEGLQLLISLFLGFPYRSIDVNDLILNFIGTIIGYKIFKIYSFLFIMSVKKFDIKLNTLLEYIHKVSEKAVNVNVNKK
ncbi:VanZ family protein [Tepidibacillus decaturensis]|uniref:VanZ family protein n=1 Tax=Tepidibacillus decaturensis TaxID=1413211 RepID=UPI000839653F